MPQAGIPPPREIDAMTTKSDNGAAGTPAEPLLFTPTTEPFPAEKLPTVFFDDDPALVDLWHAAWRIGWKHVYRSDAMPFSPYLGEGCGTNKVWIWDSCFMALWGCYAPDLYPVHNTLDNFYAILNGKRCGIKVHHPDNPPLFGWAELELYRHTGDRERVAQLVGSGVLQNHWRWLENAALPGDVMPWGAMPVLWRRLHRGYLWSGNPSGMDNTPRARGDYQYIVWVDALAQQGFFAETIAQLCEIAGNEKDASSFHARYEEKKALMQEYFDPEDGCFYDRSVLPDGGFAKVLTPASFWPVFAEMATKEQAESMIGKLRDPEKLGGPVACPSVSRDDPDFDPRGGYWRGAVWLPVFYMTMKALDRVGEFGLARNLSLQLLRWMKTCYDREEPHTIWECYSPTEPKPATTKRESLCRKDFCGWSALAPISLLIEDVIGVRSIDASTMTVTWYPPECRGRCGVGNLKTGGATISLLAREGVAEVSCDRAFTLDLAGRSFALAPGCHRLPIPR